MRRAISNVDVGGIDYLSELAGNARGTANILHYADIIRDRAILRRIISTANTIADTGYNTGGKRVEDILDEAEQRIFNIADERPKYEKSAIFSDSVQKGQLDVQ